MTLSSIEEVVDEFRNGRAFVLVDDSSPSSEGNVLFPAQMVTPQTINFLATYARGLVCLALTETRAKQLDLKMLSRTAPPRSGTEFTVSIEAREGVSTGISAADRARTISVAIDASKGSDALVSPGHVFPLVARDGGVLVRAGSTEAGVDIARLAGLNDSAVICGVLRDDGRVAIFEDLTHFAREHRLKIASIQSLIAYRRRFDSLVEQRSEVVFESEWGGRWRALSFYNSATGEENLALIKGEIDPDNPTLVRMHTLSAFTDIFREKSDRSTFLARSMEAIGEEGAGIVIVINRIAPGVLTRQMQARAKGMGSTEVEELRDYGTGAMILTKLGVKDMILLTNTHQTLVALKGYGLSIVSERSIT